MFNVQRFVAKDRNTLLMPLQVKITDDELPIGRQDGRALVVSVYRGLAPSKLCMRPLCVVDNESE
jgi:hypothetical protein